MKRYRAIAYLVWAAAIGLVAGGCGGGGGATTVAFTPERFVGTWPGSWSNSTYGSQGTAGLAVVAGQDATTQQITVTLGGNVLGGAAPAPLTLPVTVVNGGLTFDTTTATFGHLVGSISADGTVSGSATNLPNASITRVDFTGTATGTGLTVSYTVTFASGATASGTATFAKQ